MSTEYKPRYLRIPERKWHEIADFFTIIDEELAEIIKGLDIIIELLRTGKLSVPPTPPPPPPPAPAPTPIPVLWQPFTDGDTLQLTVGKDSIKISGAKLQCRIAIIKADDDNTGNIYICVKRTCTTSRGFKLAAGQAIVIEIDDLSKITVVADAEDQKLYVMWLK